MRNVLQWVDKRSEEHDETYVSSGADHNRVITIPPMSAMGGKLPLQLPRRSAPFN
jgi:hypothetical protein